MDRIKSAVNCAASPRHGVLSVIPAAVSMKLRNQDDLDGSKCIYAYINHHYDVDGNLNCTRFTFICYSGGNKALRSRGNFVTFTH